MKNNKDPILSLHNITKSFGSVVANDSIYFDLYPQEIQVLLGENGAGKSTLMKILYGMYQADQGEILINQQKVVIQDPNDALRLGIGMVHQHFMLVPVMTVTENLMLGDEKTKGNAFGKLSKLDRETVRQEIIALGNKYGLQVNPDAVVEDLSVGEAQRVEILKVLYKGADILILDEPTAVLTPQETSELFEIMRSLIKQGKSIIFITHKLKEVLAVADRIAVLRNGKVVGHTTPAESSIEELALLMVGREVLLTATKGQSHPGKVVLNIKDLSIKSKSEVMVVKNFSLQLRAGEIYGIAGVQGNGQSELIEAITGLMQPHSGHIIILNKDVTHSSPRQITLVGTAHVPEDRQKHGLVLGFSVATNLVLQTYYLPPFSNGWVIYPEKVEENADEKIDEFDIRTPSRDALVSNLSGGNQQKVIIARELSRPINLLIINQPTRGLDVGSIEYIHKRIIEARDKGVAVLLVSAELDEILSLSDRIGVMYAGELVAEMDAKGANREQLGLYMTGSKKEKMLKENINQ
ncbi:MAG: heme ABC transporter ATP-binding protein [Chloroflexi bacterium 44-23]|nr:MAG: heme ABC transporter ATP-binding protein [Chloroflexi bacterium 44-23]